MNVRGSTGGEPGAPSIETIYELYRMQILRFFMSKGLQRDAAEDLTQEVFFRLLRSGKPLANEDYTHNLIFRIAQNLAIDHFRKNNGPVQERAGAEDDIAEKSHPMLISPTSPEDVFISSETSSDVLTVLSELPDRHAKAIVLRELQGMSYREIAEYMGISEKAAESLLHRARTQLKYGLSEAGERRGGWWSAFPMLPVSLARSLAHRMSSFSKAAFKRAAQFTTGAGAVGLGGSVLNIAVVIMLVGSLVCLGVVSAGAAWQSAPDTRNASRVSSVTGETVVPAAATGEMSGENVEPRDRPVVEETTPLPATAETGAVSGLLAQPGDAARTIIENTGQLLDGTIAQLGGLLGALTDPVFMILSPIGLPPGLVSALQEICSLGAARQLTASVVSVGVNGTYLVDGLVNTMTPAVTGVAAAVTTPQGQPPASQESAPASSDAGTVESAPAQQETQPAQPPAPEPDPGAPAQEQQGNIIGDLVEFLQETLLPF